MDMLIKATLTKSSSGIVATLAKEQGWSEAQALAFIIEFYGERVDYMESYEFDFPPKAAEYGVVVTS